MRWLALLTALCACGRSDPVVHCPQTSRVILYETSFEPEERVGMWALNGSSLYSVGSGGHGGGTYVIIGASGGSMRSLTPLTPESTRVALGFWLRNSASDRGMFARVSSDGGVTFEDTESELPNLDGYRSQWLYTEAEFRVEAGSGLTFEIGIDNSTGGISIDDLRVVDVERCDPVEDSE